MIGRRSSATEATWVAPIYVLVESWETAGGDEWYAAVQGALARSAERMRRLPMHADVVHLGAFAFTSALMSLQSLRPIARREPTPSQRSFTTSFEAAFRAVGAIVDADRASLRAQGHRVFRPLIVVVAAHPPADHDAWRESLTDLVTIDDGFGTEGVARAVVVPVGVGSEAALGCAPMALPQQVSRAYEIDATPQLIETLSDLLVFASERVALMVHGSSDRFLPDDCELAGLHCLSAGSPHDQNSPFASQDVPR